MYNWLTNFNSPIDTQILYNSCFITYKAKHSLGHILLVLPNIQIYD